MRVEQIHSSIPFGWGYLSTAFSRLESKRVEGGQQLAVPQSPGRVKCFHPYPPSPVVVIDGDRS
jgi:hypothetical protein